MVEEIRSHLQTASLTSMVLMTGAMLWLAAIARAQETTAEKAPVYSVLYTFSGGADGAIPSYYGGGAGLTQDPEGNLYGATVVGGDTNSCVGYDSDGCGVVFKIDQRGRKSVLHTFSGSPDGANPGAGLVPDEEGNAYGNTVSGGAYDLGSVFKLDRYGRETVLYSFEGGADGYSPQGGLIRDDQGNVYGTTFAGGADGYGSVFKIDCNGYKTVLYSFKGNPDGAWPNAGLLRDRRGGLYGTTSAGGTGYGVVFKLDEYGKETVLYAFSGGADGGNPFVGVVADEEGNLYGTASDGGNSTGAACFGGCGVIFKLDPAGKETVLHTFTGGSDGAAPYGALLRLGSELYGTTYFGGGASYCDGLGCGVIYKLDANGKETVLYTFTGGADGGNPYAGLVAGNDGEFYGSTGYGGDLASTQPACNGAGCGVVFKLELRGGATEASGTGSLPESAGRATAEDIAAAKAHWIRSRTGQYRRAAGAGN